MWADAAEGKCLVNPGASPIGPSRMSRASMQTHLLIVDDDEKFCRLVKEYLEPLGYAVDAAHDGDEGLTQALSREYAAVILDVMLPKRNGFEVLQALRQRSSVP